MYIAWKAVFQTFFPSRLSINRYNVEARNYRNVMTSLRFWSRYRGTAISWSFRIGPARLSISFAAFRFPGAARRKPGQGNMRRLVRLVPFILVFQNRYGGGWSFEERRKTSLRRTGNVPRTRMAWAFSSTLLRSRLITSHSWFSEKLLRRDGHLRAINNMGPKIDDKWYFDVEK